MLLVDDEESIIKTVSLCLRLKGNKVIAALDGEHAVITAHKKVPDVIVLDVAMPGLNGFVVIEKIKQSIHISNIPIIILSAYGQEEYRQKAKELGIEEYMLKPFEPDHLIEVIEKVTGEK